MNEVYGIDVIAMRYFNIFGPRQDPNGPYAAVIPKFIEILRKGESPRIFGDGLQSRDFYLRRQCCFCKFGCHGKKRNVGFACVNIACGDRLTVVDLVEHLKSALSKHDSGVVGLMPEFGDKRPGDILHSHADITKAAELLGYNVVIDVQEGLRKQLIGSLSTQQFHEIFSGFCCPV